MPRPLIRIVPLDDHWNRATCNAEGCHNESSLIVDANGWITRLCTSHAAEAADLIAACLDQLRKDGRP